MKILTSVNELRHELDGIDSAKIGFVPTMGALHCATGSLVERARRECDTVVVSVFVNPTQFNDPNDLRSYPRTPDADCRLLAEVGADYVFMPAAEEIYPEPDTRQFDFGLIDKVMEGGDPSRSFQRRGTGGEPAAGARASRPGLFRREGFPADRRGEGHGRATGSSGRDRRMSHRAGRRRLALSSRNALLDEAHRAAAPHIYATLRAAARRTHELAPAELEAWVCREIESNPLLKVIYFQAVDARTMQRVATWDECPRIQGCVAVQAGSVRLIDNIKLR